MLAGCSMTVQMVPVEGPLSLRRPLPIINAKVDGILGNSGNVSLTMPNGDPCRGPWRSLGSGSTGVLIGQYGSTMLISQDRQRIGQALLVCAEGGTIDVEFVTAGSAHGFGFAKDSDGNVFRFIF